MPIKHTPLGNIKIGTIDGEEMGFLTEINTITTEELQAESDKYVSDKPYLNDSVTFTGQFRIETNNKRKMKGLPMLRGRVNPHKFWRDLQRICRGKK